MLADCLTKAMSNDFLKEILRRNAWSIEHSEFVRPDRRTEWRAWEKAQVVWKQAQSLWEAKLGRLGLHDDERSKHIKAVEPLIQYAPLSGSEVEVEVMLVESVSFSGSESEGHSIAAYAAAATMPRPLALVTLLTLLGTATSATLPFNYQDFSDPSSTEGLSIDESDKETAVISEEAADAPEDIAIDDGENTNVSEKDNSTHGFPWSVREAGFDRIIDDPTTEEERQDRKLQTNLESWKLRNTLALCIKENRLEGIVEEKRQELADYLKIQDQAESRCEALIMTSSTTTTTTTTTGSDSDEPDYIEGDYQRPESPTSVSPQSGSEPREDPQPSPEEIDAAKRAADSVLTDPSYTLGESSIPMADILEAAESPHDPFQIEGTGYDSTLEDAASMKAYYYFKRLWAKELKVIQENNYEIEGLEPLDVEVKNKIIMFLKKLAMKKLFREKRHVREIKALKKRRAESEAREVLKKKATTLPIYKAKAKKRKANKPKSPTLPPGQEPSASSKGHDPVHPLVHPVPTVWKLSSKAERKAGFKKFILPAMKARKVLDTIKWNATEGKALKELKESTRKYNEKNNIPEMAVRNRPPQPRTSKRARSALRSITGFVRSKEDLDPPKKPTEPVKLEVMKWESGKRVKKILRPPKHVPFDQWETYRHVMKLRSREEVKRDDPERLPLPPKRYGSPESNSAEKKKLKKKKKFVEIPPPKDLAASTVALKPKTEPVVLVPSSKKTEPVVLLPPPKKFPSRGRAILSKKAKAARSRSKSLEPKRNESLDAYMDRVEKKKKKRRRLDSRSPTPRRPIKSLYTLASEFVEKFGKKEKKKEKDDKDDRFDWQLSPILKPEKPSLSELLARFDVKESKTKNTSRTTNSEAYRRGKKKIAERVEKKIGRRRVADVVEPKPDKDIRRRRRSKTTDKKKNIEKSKKAADGVGAKEKKTILKYSKVIGW
jgi:hypothetical protein